MNATTAYWTEFSDVKSILLSGGTPALVSSSQYGCGVVLDATSIYWANFGMKANNYTDGTISKIDLDGSALRTLASAQTRPDGIAVDAESVYWTSFATTGAIFKIPIDGGTATVLVSGQDRPFDIAVDATSVYWTNEGER